MTYVLSEWRTHCVTPIFKSGNKHNVANYRPISLLCVTSKVLERLVFNHVIGYLTKHLSNLQFGFMTGRSSLQQLLLFMNHKHAASPQLISDQTLL